VPGKKKHTTGVGQEINRMLPKRRLRTTVETDTQCCGSGYGAFLILGSGTGFFRIPDFGSQPHNSERAFQQFFGLKNTLNFFVNWLKFFLYLYEDSIIFNLVKFIAKKLIFPPPFMLLLDPG
jgi:hypothetical protein